MAVFNLVGIAAAVVQIIHEGMEHLPGYIQQQITELHLVLRENGIYQTMVNVARRKKCEFFPNNCLGPIGGTGALGSLTRL